MKELEEALLDGRADLAVHSAKDVPGELPAGLSIVGVPARADARDAVCGAAGVAAIPEGAVVGHEQPAAPLAAAGRRGPTSRSRTCAATSTRACRKLREREYDAIVLARAGLDRLGVDEGEPVEPATLTPAPGQGCLALEARSDDERDRASSRRRSPTGARSSS